MRTLRRIVAIGLVSLFIGIIVNQFLNQGIPLRVLMLSIPGKSGWKHYQTATADSAFFHFLEESAVFVDIRPQKDFDMDHVPGALSLPFREFFAEPSLFKDQDRETTYILYDAELNSRPVRLMGRQLEKMGFQNILILRGGFIEWLDRTFPVEGEET
jgi:rhodanese-related sulfurtransferase